MGALTDRFADRRKDDIRPLIERRQPAWVERMKREGLPPKDMTGQVAA